MNKKLLVFALLFVLVLISSIFVFASIELGPKILDLDCYQEKCESEEDLWDDINSKCVFTPKISYYEEYFEIDDGKSGESYL